MILLMAVLNDRMQHAQAEALLRPAPESDAADAETREGAD